MRLTDEEIAARTEKEWNSFWLPLLADLNAAPPKPGRVFNSERDWVRFLDQVKKELTDYSAMMNEVSLAYCDLTGGQISKPHTMAFEVINAANEYNDISTKQQIIEWIDSVTISEDVYTFTAEGLIAALKEFFNIVDDEEM